ncbi:MAG: 6,7-dimethyl-8-ribityllumazine synthase [Planctomycetota bacterium]|nr:MAG: 6,7-dimethyl-8-ribityllumazine synthase [Planctomycetota bacterium]
MTTILEGNLQGKGRRVAVAVANFNQDITDSLLQGCLRRLLAAGVIEQDICVARVPGSFELPLCCERLAQTGKYDAVIALGAVIRGDTPHFDFVSQGCTDGLLRVSLKYSLPVIFGVLTTDTLEQAWHRAAPDTDTPSSALPSSALDGERQEKSTPRSNKGAESAEVALHMASLLEAI